MKKSSSQIKFHYQYYGNSQKPLILFLHGFLGNGDDWTGVIQYLSQHYYCLTIDLPGHGKTKLTANKDNSFEETAACIIELLNRHKIKKCFLTGYSLGGRLALFLALRNPQYFRKVILESASPGLGTKKEQKERIIHDEKIAKELESGDFNLFLKKWYNQTIFTGLTDHEKFNQLIQKRGIANLEGLAMALRFLSTGKQPSLWDEISQNKIPILLITGEDDIKFQKIGYEMAKLNEFIKVEVVENCSHNVHSQREKEFAHRLFQFFNF